VSEMVGDNSKTNKPESSRDCLQCRVIGASTFGGIASYLNYLRMTTPVSAPGHRLFYAVFAGSALGVAVWRATVE